FGPGTPDLGVPRVRTPLRTRLLGCSRARPDGQLRLPNRPGRRQGVGQPPVGVSARLSVVADEVEGGGARGEPYPTGAFPTFEGRPPVPARSGICGPEGEESEEEDFDDQQGDERAPLHIVGLVASLVTRAASRGVAVGRCGVASRSKNMRERDARVVAAAWRLIAREGLGALTVKALAEEAGVAPSSMLYTM